MNNDKQEIYAIMMERLINHFRKRTDVQNSETCAKKVCKKLSVHACG